MSEPAADPAGTGDQGKPLADRVSAIEAEQQHQGGKLDKIIGMLTGGDDPEDITRGNDPGLSAADMAEQMHQAVRDVNAEAAAAAPQAPPAEQRPAEVMIKGKQRLQRVIFGGDPR